MVDIRARVIPTTWMDGSNDFEARLLRAGLDGTPVVAAAGDNPWGLRHTTPMHRLLDVLDAAPAVGTLVAAALTKHRDGKLDQALRSRTAVPGDPNAGDGGALLAILLTRAVHHDPTKPVPVAVLDELGPEGVAVGKALKDALDAFEAGTLPPPAKPATSGAWETDDKGAWVERQLTLREKIDRLGPWLERDQTLAGLAPPKTPTVVDAVVVDRIDKPTTTAPAARVTGASTTLTTTTATAAAAVTLPADLGATLPSTKLLTTLGYGAGAALQIAARELAGAPGLLEKKPDGVSGFLVRQRGPQGLGP